MSTVFRPQLERLEERDTPAFLGLSGGQWWGIASSLLKPSVAYAPSPATAPGYYSIMMPATSHCTLPYGDIIIWR